MNDNSAPLSTGPRKTVWDRAIELAAIHGRIAQDVSKSDWEQAKLELTGKPRLDSKQPILGSETRSQKGDPLPGHRTRRSKP